MADEPRQPIPPAGGDSPAEASEDAAPGPGARNGAELTDKIPFTQYLRPNGEQKFITIARPSNIAQLAQEVIVAGGRFIVEELTTGEASLTVEQDDNDIAIQVVPNGPEVPPAVDRLVADAHAIIYKPRPWDATQYQGIGCYHCGREADVEGGTVEIDGSGARQRVVCLKCHRDWTNTYNFGGFIE